MEADLVVFMGIIMIGFSVYWTVKHAVAIIGESDERVGRALMGIAARIRWFLPSSWRL